MTKQRRTFSAEFKREAADLVLKQNYSFIEASRSRSVGESALRRWVDQLQQERTGVTPQSKALTCAEMSLNVLAYNLKLVMKILGTSGLMKALSA
jgi:transposase-like protein